MEMYLVGGAVRDKLLGLEPKDLDFVVVGATEEEMERLGYEKISAHFPIFMDEYKNEYALARREKKSGNGYNGFEVNFNPYVTLYDDLYRRDLTMNAIAMDEDDNLIDPFKGKFHLECGVIKAVSSHFAEDPLRVLRVAKFAARYDFVVHPDTLKMMKKIVRSGELKYLPHERIWEEIKSAIGSTNVIDKDIFFGILEECDALEYVMGVQE